MLARGFTRIGLNRRQTADVAKLVVEEPLAREALEVESTRHAAGNGRGHVVPFAARRWMSKIKTAADVMGFSLDRHALMPYDATVGGLLRALKATKALKAGRAPTPLLSPALLLRMRASS